MLITYDSELAYVQFRPTWGEDSEGVPKPEVDESGLRVDWGRAGPYAVAFGGAKAEIFRNGVAALVAALANDASVTQATEQYPKPASE